jgi:lysophospholipase L1-like esterase
MCVALQPTPAGAARSADVAPPVRILLVGDSVTQGSAGDWTWRYRLWQHFESAGVDVDFVGPRNDILDNVTNTQGSTLYADPDFDRDHAARWGMQLALPDVPIGELVETYDPDVVVEMLGVNDLIFGAKAPDAVAAAVGSFVEDARAADPEVDLVLAEATQHWFTNVPEFNADVEDLVALSTDDSRVTVAHTATDYDKYADTWDTSHPNARGEVRIAAAVADSLAAIGVGPPAARPLVMPPVGPRTPPVVRATPADGSVQLTWTDPPGATSEYIWGRDATVGEAWQGPWQVTGSTWTALYLVNGHRYQYRLQPIKGDDEPEGDVRSLTVTAVPFPPPLAPEGMRAVAGRRCATLRWKAPAYAERYQVERFAAGGWRSLGWTEGTAFTRAHLPAVRSWRFRVTAWHATTPGIAATIKVRRDPTAGACR